jgi:predicted DNA-binding protein
MSDTATHPSETTVPVHTRLSTEAVDVIDRLAAADRRSRSFFVREFVEGYLAEHGDELAERSA